MGFFSDLKEDLSQAVNELIPEEDSKAGELKEEAVQVTENEEEITNDECLETDEVNEDLSELESMLERVDSIDLDEVDDEDTNQIEELISESEQAGTDDELKFEREEIVSALEKKEETITKYDKGGFRMEMQMRDASDETAIITAGMTIKGDIESEGSMEVIGTINGNINILGKLNITGTINGNSQAEEIYADNAKINGEINSEGAVKIGQSSVVIGNIFASSAVIAGAVKGDIDVNGPVILDTSAIVMGNIKSKAVQINNGAVIEGMCSQCYADVSPTSFFEDLKGTK